MNLNWKKACRKKAENRGKAKRMNENSSKAFNKAYYSSQSSFGEIVGNFLITLKKLVRH